MSCSRVAIFIASLAVATTIVEGHGRVVDPAHRGHAWRVGFNTPVDYDDNANFCGGFNTQHALNKGKCGVCGDNYADKRPRDNENGGRYGTGTIVRTYKAGSVIEVVVQLTASHKGHFEFSICPLKYEKQLETENCFDAHKLKLAIGGYNYTAIDKPRFYPIKVLLPAGLTCEHCVLRWHYRTGNNWGVCDDGQGAIGCGIQENFRTCSDIKIV